MSSESQNAMRDMVKEIRRITKVFEEAHSELKGSEVKSGIMTALLAVFVEYSIKSGLSMDKIRDATEYAFQKYEKII